jgi:hypothetical protein
MAMRRHPFRAIVSPLKQFSWRAEIAWLSALPVIIGSSAALSAVHGHKIAGRPSLTSPDTVALVGTTAISKGALDWAMQEVTVDLRPQPSAETRGEVLSKLIDEELLFQYGLKHNIVESDPFVRLAIVRTMLALACSSSGRPDRRQLVRDSKRDVGNPPVDAADCVRHASSTARERVDLYARWLRQRAVIEMTKAP